MTDKQPKELARGFDIRFISKQEWVSFKHGHVLPPPPISPVLT